MTVSMPDRVAVFDPDAGNYPDEFRWFYRLTGPVTNVELTAHPVKGESFPAKLTTEVRLGVRWIGSPVELRSVTASYPDTTRTVGHRLDPTVEPNDDRPDFVEDYDDIPDRYEGLYSRETVTVEVPDDEIDLTDCLILAGCPDAIPDNWTADLPFELRNWPQDYRHLFPGKLHGLRDIASEALESIPGVSGVYIASIHKTHSIYVLRSVEDPIAGESTHRINLAEHGVERPPDFMAGSDLADAQAKWDTYLADLVDRVSRAAAVRFVPVLGGEAS